jgi:hypothetical protein
MSSTTPKFSAKEICAIIKQCHESGVSEIKLDSLRVTFSDQKKNTTEENVYVEVPMTDEMVLSANSQARESNERDEELSMQDKLDQLAIEDPVEFERLQALGAMNEGS